MPRLGATVAALGVGALSLTLGACAPNVMNNPNCLTRVNLEGSYGGGIPTGKWRASAVCGKPATEAKPADVPAPPAADTPAPREPVT